MANTGQPLLQLQDGDILEFSEDTESWNGCESCDYGSRYIQDFTIKTTKGDYVLSVDQMYEYAVSQDLMFKTILPNVDEIKGMTVEGFVEWLVCTIDVNADKFCNDFKIELTVP